MTERKVNVKNIEDILQATTARTTEMDKFKTEHQLTELVAEIDRYRNEVISSTNNLSRGKRIFLATYIEAYTLDSMWEEFHQLAIKHEPLEMGVLARCLQELQSATKEATAPTRQTLDLLDELLDRQFEELRQYRPIPFWMKVYVNRLELSQNHPEITMSALAFINHPFTLSEGKWDIELCRISAVKLGLIKPSNEGELNRIAGLLLGLSTEEQREMARNWQTSVFKRPKVDLSQEEASALGYGQGCISDKEEPEDMKEWDMVEEENGYEGSYLESLIDALEDSTDPRLMELLRRLDGCRAARETGEVNITLNLTTGEAKIQY